MKIAQIKPIWSTAVLAVILTCSALTVTASEEDQPARPPHPNISLPRRFHGEAAIVNLAEQLPAVALSYGHAPDELRGLFRSDPTLNVDEQGRLLYLDAALPQPTAQVQATVAASATAPYPLENTFLLHSRLGSQRVIYLDFNGHVLTGTAWNSGTVPASLTCPAWDVGGDPSVFDNNERTIIQGIWQRVSDDYRPFDVDVTTEDPGEAAMNKTDSADLLYGTRALISPISSYFGNYGGIAYVGVFDSGSFYKPALIFPENLANAEKYIAEAISHEVGHNLGLSHDGTASTGYYAGSGSGETGWAPIMGVGYYENLTQFSKGEYSGANNQEDDLVIIQSHGLAYRADDHGNTMATATVLPSGGTLNVSGVIERSSDVDVFAFSSEAGTISITVTPAYYGNLDVYAELRNSGGVVIASSNPIGVLAASINITVPSAGTYYLFVSGTGQGDPLTGYSNYDSLGAYTVTGTVVVPVGNQPPIAQIKVTSTSGLSVAFDGSGSYDPNGDALTYLWDFGDGSGDTGAIPPTHSYAAAGTYAVTLTVKDTGGLSSLVSMTILVNRAPTASFTAAASTTASQTINFDASASSDPDLSALTYQWNFGDGTTGSGGSSPFYSHSYASGGTFNVTLTVTDNLGGTGSVTTSVVVQADLTKVMHVFSISITTANGIATAKVLIIDGNKTAVSGATVTGSWSGAVAGTASGLTGSDGYASIKSKSYKKPGTITFTVSSVTKTGFTYSASASITKATK